MEFKQRTLMQIADMICGNYKDEESFFSYRSSSHLTEFFRDCDADHVHDGSTRQYWVADTLKQLLAEPRSSPNVLPETFGRVVRALMDQSDAKDEGPSRPAALAMLDGMLAREGYEALYADDEQCYLRHVPTNTIGAPGPNPHRPFSPEELKRRQQLLAYLEETSEDALIEDVLLPLFRQLGFHRITAAGHKDKQLEYGKDVWMKFTLPTLHVLYFGMQVKRGKLDASGVSKGATANVAEALNQITMMLGHEIFDPRSESAFLSITRSSSPAVRSPRLGAIGSATHARHTTRHAGLDTSGLVGTGAWRPHAAARTYEHVESGEEARKADFLPALNSGELREKPPKKAQR
jgi:hypothetical protein